MTEDARTQRIGGPPTRRLDADSGTSAPPVAPDDGTQVIEQERTKVRRRMVGSAPSRPDLDPPVRGAAVAPVAAVPPAGRAPSGQHGPALLAITRDVDDLSLVRLGDRPLGVGRAPLNDLVIRSPYVSANHAVLRRDPATGAVLVNDLGSTNGTLVDGRAITAETTLLPGHRVQFGRMGPVYELGDAGGASA